MRTVESLGWGTNVTLGSGQADMLDQLQAAVKHPSRTWHRAPRMRDLGRWPSANHRVIHRLAALGVIAVQTTYGTDPQHPGRASFVRFTFGVRRWLWRPPSRRQVARMRPRIVALVAPGQLALAHAEPPGAPPPRPSPRLGVTPVFDGACHVCGAWGRVAEGVWKDDQGRYDAGHRCVDHAACAARRARA